MIEFRQRQSSSYEARRNFIEYGSKFPLSTVYCSISDDGKVKLTVYETTKSTIPDSVEQVATFARFEGRSNASLGIVVSAVRQLPYLYGATSTTQFVDLYPKLDGNVSAIPQGVFVDNDVEHMITTLRRGLYLSELYQSLSPKDKQRHTQGKLEGATCSMVVDPIFIFFPDKQSSQSAYPYDESLHRFRDILQSKYIRSKCGRYSSADAEETLRRHGPNMQLNLLRNIVQSEIKGIDYLR